MYGWKDLKKRIERKNGRIPCPFYGCQIKVPQMTNKSPNLKSHKEDLQDYFCQEHEIYISPTTFKYDNENDNLLWSGEDLQFLNKVKKPKQESRMDHDNSEDALSWNVFRYLEKHNLVSEYLFDLVKKEVTIPEVIYWSYYEKQKDQKSWNELQRGREQFETRPKNIGSEPDVIINSESALFFIESKLTDRPKTPSVDFNKVEKKYTTGGNNWFSKVFKPGFDFKEIAMAIKNYQLVRFWLIGSWMANEKGKNFYLYNLVRKEEKKRFENKLNGYIIENDDRKYFVSSWEDIYRYILTDSHNNKDKNIILDYFKNKTIGYTNSKAEIGNLQKAFSI